MIPSHSSGDIIALVANTMHAPKVSSADLDSVFQRLRLRVPAFSARQVYQVLELFRQGPPQPVGVLKDLLGDLKEGLLVRDASLAPSELVRGISTLAKLEGIAWDPRIVLHALETLLPPVLTGAEIVSLCESGLFDLPGLSAFAMTLHERGSLSSIQTAKLAYYTGQRALWQASETCSPALAPWRSAALAAWGWGESPGDVLPFKPTSALTARQAQISVWALLAWERTLPEIPPLWDLANSGTWASVPMKRVCAMRLDPAYVPPYPVRLPQLGLPRKIAALKALTGVQINVQHEARFALDLAHEGQLVELVTFPNDPSWRIYKQFLPPTITLIGIDDFLTQKYVA